MLSLSLCSVYACLFCCQHRRSLCSSVSATFLLSVSVTYILLLRRFLTTGKMQQSVVPIRNFCAIFIPYGIGYVWQLSLQNTNFSEYMVRRVSAKASTIRKVPFKPGSRSLSSRCTSPQPQSIVGYILMSRTTPLTFIISNSVWWLPSDDSLFTC